MTLEEQNKVLSVEYAEANRYMDNAKETLKEAEKRDDGYYVDAKYVRSACETAYLGVLRALEAWLVLRVDGGRFELCDIRRVLVL